MPEVLSPYIAPLVDSQIQLRPELPKKRPFVVIEGDGAANELLAAAMSVLDATKVPLEPVVFDLSIKNRRKTNNSIVYAAADVLGALGFGIKAATKLEKWEKDAPQKEPPDRILREQTEADVILRTARVYPGTSGVDSLGLPDRGPITVVRMAYSPRASIRLHDDKGEIAIETRTMHEDQCKKVSEYAFRFAEQVHHEHGVVFGGPDIENGTYDGMLTREIWRAHNEHDSVDYVGMSLEDVYYQLGTPDMRHLIIPALDRDGNMLSSLAVAATHGTTEMAPSTTLTLDSEFNPKVVMTDCLNDTVANAKSNNEHNPVGMILAAANLLSHMPGEHSSRASQAIYGSVMDTLREGVKTKDLGGKAKTSEFTGEVVARVKDKMKPQKS